MKTIKLPCYSMTVKINKSGAGTITSDLHETGADITLSADEYDVAIDSIESLVLAHACAGIDIQSPAYVNGIESAVEAIFNHNS